MLVCQLCSRLMRGSLLLASMLHSTQHLIAVLLALAATQPTLP